MAAQASLQSVLAVHPMTHNIGPRSQGPAPVHVCLPLEQTTPMDPKLYTWGNPSQEQQQRVFQQFMQMTFFSYAAAQQQRGVLPGQPPLPPFPLYPGFCPLPLSSGIGCMPPFYPGMAAYSHQYGPATDAKTAPKDGQVLIAHSATGPLGPSQPQSTAGFMPCLPMSFPPPPMMALPQLNSTPMGASVGPTGAPPAAATAATAAIPAGSNLPRHLFLPHAYPMPPFNPPLIPMPVAAAALAAFPGAPAAGTTAPAPAALQATTAAAAQTVAAAPGAAHPQAQQQAASWPESASGPPLAAAEGATPAAPGRVGVSLPQQLPHQQGYLQPHPVATAGAANSKQSIETPTASSADGACIAATTSTAAAPGPALASSTSSLASTMAGVGPDDKLGLPLSGFDLDFEHDLGIDLEQLIQIEEAQGPQAQPQQQQEEQQEGEAGYGSPGKLAMADASSLESTNGFLQELFSWEGGPCTGQQGLAATCWPAAAGLKAAAAGTAASCGSASGKPKAAKASKKSSKDAAAAGLGPKGAGVVKVSRKSSSSTGKQLQLQVGASVAAASSPTAAGPIGSPDSGVSSGSEVAVHPMDSSESPEGDIASLIMVDEDMGELDFEQLLGGEESWEDLLSF